MKKIDLFYHTPTDEYLNKQEVRKIYYHISLPNVWNEEIFELLNVIPVYEDHEPDTTSSQYCRLNDTPTVKDNYHLFEYSIFEYDNNQLQTQNEGKWQEIRSQRNSLLQETDWTQLPDSPLSDDDRMFYQEYRQELRDITKNSDPNNIVWPIDPYKDLLLSVL